MESALYGIYALVRFLIRQQLVRTYRTPALSMKYSLYSVITKLVRPRYMCMLFFAKFFFFFSALRRKQKFKS